MKKFACFLAPTDTHTHILNDVRKGKKVTGKGGNGLVEGIGHSENMHTHTHTHST